MQLLVTAFGPFPGARVNPTGPLAHRLAASRRLARLGIMAIARVLETRYALLAGDLPEALNRGAPDIVLMLGLAPRRRLVCVEARAVNRSSRTTPDAGRALPQAIRQGLPEVLRTRAPVAAAVAALARAGLPARLSIDAGRYLCNASYHAALRQAGLRGALVLFVHVPWPAPAPGTRARGRAIRRPPPRADSCAGSKRWCSSSRAPRGRVETAQWPGTELGSNPPPRRPS